MNNHYFEITIPCVKSNNKRIVGSTAILMEYLFLCPLAGQAFHFFLDEKTKQKNHGLQ